VRAGPHGLSDLDRRRLVERWRDRVREVAAFGADLVAPRAVLGEALLPIGEVAVRRLGAGNARAAAERRDVRHQLGERALRELDAAAARYVVRIAERHVARA